MNRANEIFKKLHDFSKNECLSKTGITRKTEANKSYQTSTGMNWGSRWLPTLMHGKFDE